MKRIGDSLSPQTIIAAGAEMKSRFYLNTADGLYCSEDYGNTLILHPFKEYVYSFMKEVKEHKPEVILTDLHPSYNVSQMGKKIATNINCKHITVQHHRAHAYSVALEHGLKSFKAIICDGLGFGDDSRMWGGEVFSDNERIGNLELQPQVGGDMATKEPARMLVGILSKFLSIEEISKYVSIDSKDIELMQKQISQGYNCPLTSSTGRVFDAASALLGFCKKMEYEGSPAIKLDQNATEPYNLEPVIEDNVLLTTPLFEYLIANLDKDKGRLAGTVIRYVSEGLLKIAGDGPIVFSGGCALSKNMREFMSKNGVLMNKEIPCDDYGIGYGQIAWYLANSGNDNT